MVREAQWLGCGDPRMGPLSRLAHKLLQCLVGSNVGISLDRGAATRILYVVMSWTSSIVGIVALVTGAAEACSWTSDR